MFNDVIAINAITLGGHVAFYGGAFLPLLSIIIRQEKLIASKNFLYWSAAYAIAALVFGCAMYFTMPDFLLWAIPLTNNSFFIIFGFWMLTTLVRANTQNLGLHQKTVIIVIAVIQAVMVWQAIATSYAITSQIHFPQIAVAMICFILAIIIHVAIVSFILWIIASTSRTKKLQRYLAGLFAFLCLVIGILNFL